MDKKIYVEVRYAMKPGKRDEFYAKVVEQGIIAASQAEEGNEKYDWLFVPGKEDEIVLLEIWKNDEVRKAHYEEEHYKKLAVLKAEYVDGVQLLDHYMEPLA